MAETLNPDLTGRRAGEPLGGVVLAGGRAARMGGRDKALEPLAGRPLLQHVIERLDPQVEELCLSVEKVAERYDAFGLAQVADESPGGGPLGGLLAAMRWVSPSREWLLLVPCDAPFLPLDLGARLHARAEKNRTPGAVAVYGGVVQPTFSLWHRDLLPALELAVTEDRIGGFMQFLNTVRLAGVSWRPATPGPFFNINEEATLDEAEQMIRQQAERNHAQCQ